MLQVGAADAIEHAILLCNYLLFMNYTALVVFGQSLIDGISAFVIFKPKEQMTISTTTEKKVSTLNLFKKEDMYLPAPFKICNPITGLVYELSDKYCPITEIYGCFDDQNVYANNLSDKKIEKVNFNFKDTSIWRPFFSSSNPLPELNSIQVL
jgi:hypothetical protein